MFTNPFESKKQDHLIPANCDVVVVGDLFAEDYLGGAELTTRALIEASPGIRLKSTLALKWNSVTVIMKCMVS